MDRTPSGDRRQALQRSAREMARDARALQKAADRAPAARPRGKGCKERRRRPWQRPRTSNFRPDRRT